MRSSHARRVFFVTFTMTVYGSLASAASIGLFADSTCTSCNLTIPFGSTRTMYVSAVMEGLPQSPLVGAELRIEGPPAFWIIDVTPNPAAGFVFGDLFGSGAAINFPLKGIGGSCILLYTVTLLNSLDARDVVLRAASVDPPRPGFPCPVVALSCPCEPFCVGGGGDLREFVAELRGCDGLGDVGWYQAALPVTSGRALRMRGE